MSAIRRLLAALLSKRWFSRSICVVAAVPLVLWAFAPLVRLADAM
jgi:hypothetical protein